MEEEVTLRDVRLRQEEKSINTNHGGGKKIKDEKIVVSFRPTGEEA